MKITVFTPTYNRGYLLDKLYRSLLKQTNTDFEWLIIDDGSTDDTKAIVQSFIRDDKIKIRYIFQENGGKHRAINKGLDIAEGELFFIVDSDDTLIPTAIELVLEKYKSVENYPEFAGISFNRGYSEKEIVGKTFSSEFMDCTNLERGRNNILGDKSEIYRTKILRKIKFPEIEGENFMSEIVLWNEVARQGYKLRWFNEIIYICDYLGDGLTVNRESIYLNNPIAHKLMINELLQIDFPIKSKVNIIYNYYKLWKDKKSLIEISEDININKFSLVGSIVIGVVKSKIRRRK
ncbi:glycosyltransferase family 2 protein [Gemella sp.]